jgi:hypothetical protein
MSAAQGRFTSADPDNAGASPGDPQTWNGYAYAGNNPVIYTDPDGLAYRLCDRDGNCQDNYPDRDFNQNFLKDRSIDISGPYIVKNGKVIGTFERTSADDLSPTANEFVRQMSAQRQATKEFIGDLILRATIGGVIGGAFSIALPAAPTATTLGLGRAAGATGRTLNEVVGHAAANTVRNVLKGRMPLNALTAEQRTAAAAFYRAVATRTGGTQAAAAARYNLARAEFLEGTRAALSRTLPEFIKNGF